MASKAKSVYKVYKRGGLNRTTATPMHMIHLTPPWLARNLACGLLLGTAALGLPAHAQDKASRSALIVGVSTYASPDVSTLSGVPADIPLAQDMARAMGIPAERTRVLRDGAATKAAVLEALDHALAREKTLERYAVVKKAG